MTTKKINDPKKQIIATLAYFDIFDHPLTLSEIIRLHVGPFLNSDLIIESLDALIEEKIIGIVDGCYFLSGRQGIVPIRQKRYYISQKKWLKTKRSLKYFRYIPFIEVVFICNSLAYNDADDDSDIDLFIITRSKRIWMARLAISLIFGFFGLRRHGNKVKDRFCLSFYVSQDHFNLQDIQIDNDWYLRYWVKLLMPIYGKEKEIDDFFKANTWVDEYIAPSPFINHYRYGFFKENNKAMPARAFERLFCSKMGDWLEKFLSHIQKRKIAVTNLKLKPRENGVVVSDDMLKFHPREKRQEYRNLYLSKLKDLALDSDLEAC